VGRRQVCGRRGGTATCPATPPPPCARARARPRPHLQDCGREGRERDAGRGVRPGPARTRCANGRLGCTLPLARRQHRHPLSKPNAPMEACSSSLTSFAISSLVWGGGGGRGEGGEGRGEGGGGRGEGGCEGSRGLWLEWPGAGRRGRARARAGAATAQRGPRCVGRPSRWRRGGPQLPGTLGAAGGREGGSKGGGKSCGRTGGQPAASWGGGRGSRRRGGGRPRARSQFTAPSRAPRALRRPGPHRRPAGSWGRWRARRQTRTT
jgi:hypothetical protein